MGVIKKRLFGAFAAILCTTSLAGCSLFELKTEPANVYLPADPVVASHASSTSSEIRGDYPYYSRSTSTSDGEVSSSRPTQTVTPEETEPLTFIENYYGKWYYNHISARQRQVYRRLYEAAKNNVEEIDVSDIVVNKNDIFAAFWAFDYENPQFLSLGSGYEITFLNEKLSNYVQSVKILYGRSAANVPQSDFEARAEEVLEQAGALESDYERLKYVHDWIVDNTEYSKTDALYESEADGPIVRGRALCEGYSKAFMYFAQSLGYHCICSVGTANLEDHMWNMVKIGRKWYNVDVTWDDPKNSDGSQTLRHDYFLINDAQIRLDHRVEHPLMLPDAPDGYFPYGYSQDGDTDSAADTSSSTSGSVNTSSSVNSSGSSIGQVD